jgi:glycosyltransferase involved in cell wall biosynthesis
MTAARPTLSICVPTRNRQQHLERCLERVLVPGAFPFAIEVVVSDNASSDDTAAVARRWIDRGMPVRYHRHAANVGAYGNQFSALRRARGEYAIYLADDDRLNIDNLVEAIAWLERHPGCVASYGPIETVDAVENVSCGLTYAIPEDRVFEDRNRLELVAFMTERRIIPEIGIYRVAALANTLFVTHTLYWAYPLLDRLLGYGFVCFRAKPHYVGLLRQWLGDDARVTGQQEFRLDDWESFYHGLRFFYYTALVKGEAPSSPEAGASLEKGIAAFGSYFRNQAIYTIARTGKLSEALDVVKLLSGAHAIEPHPALAGLAANSAAVAVYAICELFDQAGDVTRIALHGFGADAGQIVGAFKSVRPALEIAACDDPGALAEPERVLLIVADDGLRGALVGSGFLPGRVVCLRGIIANFNLAPWLSFAERGQ